MFILKTKILIYLNHNTKGLDIFIMICMLWIVLAIFLFKVIVMIIKIFDL